MGQGPDTSIFDKYGNKWIDWSSGVLVTNAGHAAPEIMQGHDRPDQQRPHSQLRLPERRTGGSRRADRLHFPDGLKKVFLLSTGSEATECAIKLSRTHGIKVGGKEKIGIIGFTRGFHGRTLASQQAGGMGRTEGMDRE